MLISKASSTSCRVKELDPGDVFEWESDINGERILLMKVGGTREWNAVELSTGILLLVNEDDSVEPVGGEFRRTGP